MEFHNGKTLDLSSRSIYGGTFINCTLTMSKLTRLFLCSFQECTIVGVSQQDAMSLGSSNVFNICTFSVPETPMRKALSIVEMAEIITAELRTQRRIGKLAHYVEARDDDGKLDYVAIDGNPDLLRLAAAVLIAVRKHEESISETNPSSNNPQQVARAEAGNLQNQGSEESTR